MYKQAMEIAQSADKEKVGFNLQIPKNLKFEFEQQCKQDGVSVTSMITALMEVGLTEAYLESIPKAKDALSRMKNILQTEDVYYPHSISKDDPKYAKTVSENEFKQLMEIDLELALAIDEYKELHNIYFGAEYSYKFEPINMMESARTYIRKISQNMDKRDEFAAVQEKYMNIVHEKFISRKDEK